MVSVAVQPSLSVFREEPDENATVGSTARSLWSLCRWTPREELFASHSSFEVVLLLQLSLLLLL